MDFSSALNSLKRGAKATRAVWKNVDEICLRIPEKGSPITTPYFTARTPEGHTLWTPSTADLLADDWDITAQEKTMPSLPSPTPSTPAPTKAAEKKQPSAPANKAHLGMQTTTSLKGKN